MKPQEQRCKVIAELYLAGNDAKAIIKATNYCHATVYNVLKKLKAGQGIAHTPCGPHKAKKRTPMFLAGLKRSIKANPAVSMVAHAKRRSVSRRTMGRAIKEDLGLSTYVRGRCHLLTEKMKTVRLERGKKLRQICKNNPRTIRLFSDESIFTVDGVYNPKNDRWIAEERASVPPVMRTKYPIKIMIFSVISSDGKAMLAHIFPPKFRLTTAGYLDLLETVVLPWLASTYPPGTKFLWIQDSAPAHVSKASMNFLNSKFDVMVQPDQWPSNSPDLNPCDY